MVNTGAVMTRNKNARQQAQLDIHGRQPRGSVQGLSQKKATYYTMIAAWLVTALCAGGTESVAGGVIWYEESSAANSEKTKQAVWMDVANSSTKASKKVTQKAAP